jgi:hypothetical protein
MQNFVQNLGVGDQALALDCQTLQQALSLCLVGPT